VAEIGRNLSVSFAWGTQFCDACCVWVTLYGSMVWVVIRMTLIF